MYPLLLADYCKNGSVGRHAEGEDEGWAAGRLLLAGRDVVGRWFISWITSQGAGEALGWGPDFSW